MQSAQQIRLMPRRVACLRQSKAVPSPVAVQARVSRVCIICRSKRAWPWLNCLRDLQQAPPGATVQLESTFQGAEKAKSVKHPERVTETDAHAKCRGLLDSGLSASEVGAFFYLSLSPGMQHVQGAKLSLLTLPKPGCARLKQSMQ